MSSSHTETKQKSNSMRETYQEIVSDIYKKILVRDKLDVVLQPYNEYLALQEAYAAEEKRLDNEKLEKFGLDGLNLTTLDQKIRKKQEEIEQHKSSATQSDINLVKDLNYDPNIYKKYHIKKYIVKSTIGEEVEIWRYQKESLAFPILEDQATKRGESLLTAARELFKNDDQKLKLLSHIETNYQSQITKFFDMPFDKKNDFEKQQTALSELINQLLNDIAYVWGHCNPDITAITKQDYQAFFINLFQTVEEVCPAFKTRNLLVFNEVTQTVQYYERGTYPDNISKVDTQEKEKNSDDKQSESINHNKKVYYSAHRRADVGIPNFIAYGTGYIKNTKPIITDTAFRMASLPPTRLYGTKRDQDTLEMTVQNMEALWKEMASRVAPESKGKTTEELPPTFWINVGLLTVDQQLDKENQGRQYRETIIAANRLYARSKGQFNPIIFDFGVNWAAQGNWIYKYPSDQKFENQRAFSQLLDLAALNLKLVENEKLSDDAKAIIKIFQSLIDLSYQYRIALAGVNQLINYHASMYDASFYQYIKNPDEKTKKEMLVALKNLSDSKSKQYKTIDNNFTLYKTTFLEKQKTLNSALNNYNKEHKSNDETAKRLSIMCEDLLCIHDYFLNDTWHKKENNFKLQSRIIDFGQQIHQLESLYKSKICTVTTFHCKSNNDRSSAMAAYVDQLRQSRIDPNLDKVNHYIGGAWALSTVIDTDGGGPKFDGNSHPDSEFSKFQKATSKWATHKLGDTTTDMLPLHPKLIHDNVLSELSLVPILDNLRNLMKKIVSKDNQQSSQTESKEYADRSLFVEVFEQLTKTIIQGFHCDYFNAQLIDACLNHSSYTKLKEIEKVRLHEMIKEFIDERDKLMKFNSPSFIPLTPESSADVMKAFSKEIDKYKENVKTYQGWISASSSMRSFYQKKSSDTESIHTAYNEYSTKHSQASTLQKIMLLQNIQAAINHWIIEKHGTQFEASDSSKDESKSTIVIALREHSRLPAVLALQNHIQSLIQGNLEALENEVGESLNKLSVTNKSTPKSTS